MRLLANGYAITNPDIYGFKTNFGYKFCGISSEICSFLMENAFGYLKFPVSRIALPDVPTSCSFVLEKVFYPNIDKIVLKIKETLGAY